MEITDLNAVIGLVGAPALIILLVDHLKQFCRGIPIGPSRDGASPWPLAVDVTGVGWAFALWHAGILGETIETHGVELRWTSVLLIGLALGVASAKLWDAWQGRTPDPSA